MSSFPEATRLMRALAAGVLLSLIWVKTAHAEKFARIGRAATSSEIAAWNIDVRPDFQGLPRGSGSPTRAGSATTWSRRAATATPTGSR